MVKGWALLQNHFLVLYVERWQNGINLKSTSNRLHKFQEVKPSFYSPFISFGIVSTIFSIDSDYLQKHVESVRFSLTNSCGG
jgi:hypothetical protein